MGCPAPPMGFMGHPGTCSGPPGATQEAPNAPEHRKTYAKMDTSARKPWKTLKISRGLLSTSQGTFQKLSKAFQKTCQDSPKHSPGLLEALLHPAATKQQSTVSSHKRAVTNQRWSWISRRGPAAGGRRPLNPATEPSGRRALP